MSIYRCIYIHVGWETLSLCAHFPSEQLVLRLPANISAHQAGNARSLLGMSWGHFFFCWMPRGLTRQMEAAELLHSSLEKRRAL